MSQAIIDMPEDLEQLQQQLTEFRNTHRVRSRLPEPLWAAATELSVRYGVYRTARVLHLDYIGLKKRGEGRKQPKSKRRASIAPEFVELVEPAVVVPRCTVEVETPPGKLRLELPATATPELAHLIRAFLNQ